MGVGKLSNKNQSKEVAEKIWHHYDTLFHHLLPKVVYENHPEHGFSEIMIGQTIGVPLLALKKEFLNPIKLETLIIGVYGGKRTFENYNTKISSFMSEYGFSII